VTINGGTLNNSSGFAMTLNVNPAFTWNGDFELGGSDLNLGSGAVTLTSNRTVTLNGGTVTVGGPIGDGGSNYALTKAGYSTLRLSGANTYKGNTTVSAGTLVLTNNARFATNSTVTIEVTAGALLQLDFTATNTVAGLVLDGTPQPAGVYGTSNSTPGFAGTGSLRVAGSSPAPAATNITYTVNGGQLVLNWPTGQGWQLQAQTNSRSVGLSTNWFNVSGATPPYTNTFPSEPVLFYRLAYP
jgi:autotransporter-associated beta strand protein